MKKLILSVFAATALFSCKNENKTADDATKETEEVAMTT
ncbi:MAG TPA: MBL fold metallo-hydrolase, partial [Leeuwenhoekiella sp.]|nr:MBL fold metallo-hydrolase [Leeuwenhoekiella sp.]